MKVLQLISSEGFYGAESMLVTLSEALSNQNCQVVVGAFSDSRTSHTEVLVRARQAELQVRAVACHGRWDWKTVGRIRDILTDCNVDVLHTHGYKADLYGYAATFGHRCARVATCHNWPDPRPIMRAYAAIDKFVVRYFNAVATPSPVVLNVLKRAGVRKQKLSYIGNGVNLEPFEDATPSLHRDEPGDRVVGFVGRLVPGKGGAVLLNAAKQVLDQFPRATFVFVGEGPCRIEWSELAERLGIAERVRFTGERKDMPEVYASFDVAVLPSLAEAMPMCLLEAMAAGRPVVATRVGAIPGLITPDVTGVLVDPGDAGGLAHAILRVLTDSVYANRLAAAGRAHIQRQYSSEAMARHYLNLYRQALADRCIAPPTPRAAEG